MDEMAAKIEIWKKIVDVQQHFNDLELRIRNFALIVTGAFLGLGGYAIKDGGFESVSGYSVSSAALIVGTSLVPLIAFYLMDRLWYHRLLDGSVKAGIAAEGELNNLGLTVNLGEQVSKSSPFVLPLFGVKVHSRHKMDGFYGILCLAIIALTLTLALGIRPISAGVSLPAVNLQVQKQDDQAARAVCKAYVQSLLSKASGVPGSVAIDPHTGKQAVLVAGHWNILPQC